jgi:hypothetical protein
MRLGGNKWKSVLELEYMGSAIAQTAKSTTRNSARPEIVTIYKTRSKLDTSAKEITWYSI